LVVLVPVFFGFMGFAVDLGRLYLIRGELKTATNAMALAAAATLVGTEASGPAALTAARLPITDTDGNFANRYDFGGVSIAEGNAMLSTAVPDPTLHDTIANALSGGSESSASTARHARVALTADAPLLFWSFLSLGQARTTPIAALAVAGRSAPLCTACGIEPIAIAALDPADTENFGFALNSRYTFGYFCNGAPQPSGIVGSPQRIPYMLPNRLNDEATLFPEENSQLFRMGASGLPSNPNPARACFSVNAAETTWLGADPLPCNQNRVPAQVQSLLCGIASRFDTAPPTVCETIPEVSTIASAYTPDLDITNLDDYSAYTGNLRRVITAVIVDVLIPGGTMTVLGFRQFLVQPNQNDITVNAGDQNARFAVLYIGSAVPLRQGTMSGCSLQFGPGKVVLHQ
jgi:Flp pilus assembly protein TadG